MQYQSYPEYGKVRESSLGKKPKNWESRRLKFSIKLKNIKINAKETDFEYMGMENIESFTGRKIFDEENPVTSEGVGSLFEKNDVLFGKLRPYLAKAYLCKEQGFCSTELLVFEGEKLTPKFLQYMVLSDWFVSMVDSSTYGAKMPRASWDFIGNLESPLPPETEQEAIVRFLDFKTRQIDSLIEKKKALIEKLDEQRIAVITQAVTKGINGKAKMKPSGVEWLGDIPEHWEIRRLKESTITISKGTTPSTEGADILDEGPVRFLKAENIFEGGIKNTPNVYISSDTHRLLKRSELAAGDVLFVIAGATLGKVATLKNDLLPANTNQAVAFLRPDKNIESDYLALWLQSTFVKEMTWLHAVQSAQPNLAMGVLGNFFIPLPSIEEQNEIIEYVNTTTKKKDKMKALNNTAIGFLNEYRNALITNAVTGKIDVQNIQIPKGE